jgi:hypothetical protein
MKTYTGILRTAGAAALAVAGLLAAAGQSDVEAWRVLHLAIEFGGASAEEVFGLLGTIDDEESRKLLEQIFKSESGWAGPRLEDSASLSAHRICRCSSG